MKIPSEVVWGLTKRWNSTLVKFNHQQFSKDPLNLTGYHNASSSGYANERAIGLQGKKEPTKKKFRSTYSLLVKHKETNRRLKKKKNSRSLLQYSVNDLRGGVHKAVKAIEAMELSEMQKKRALKRLQRLAKAGRPQVKADAKKEAKK
mmetsp:Transcript_16176/g.11682  ORF Transcript_16176/g.11682 Transcript_16176/m.11682 type:complete len:148 (+) Transcript_16176:41-484(+)|eukprot:CAMPEP_0202967712 /NCGR_PEP_ID=MMETSP1396-20130829/12713_1 /ASSEMBLY_ACC=CAM_ASM_000872 /TAXON_ID= /ORGANISM="Pseudokeronopsis sp., Strain Brazil" /LENGTH=147 /DNA_ID=CAMNT_0049693123 /DNA_START=41 /DNA_END=484 /DNA_ORIENTATION=-